MTPKRHFVTRNDVFWRILLKNPFKGIGCIGLRTKNERKNYSHQKARQITYLGAETPEPIAKQFRVSGAVHDVITPANFGEDRSTGFGMAMGRILAFFIDLLRRH